MYYIGNAFSLNMINSNCQVRFVFLSDAQAASWVQDHTPESAVGHADTAAVLSSLLGTPVPMNRMSLSLSYGDEILVGQYSGPRLPEGATSLPEGARIQWIRCIIEILDFI